MSVFVTLVGLEDLKPTDNLVGVRVALWDVRAQWESGLRTLTAAQSCLEQWPTASSDSERRAQLMTLQEQLKALREVNAAVRDVLAGVRDVLDNDVEPIPKAK